MQNSLQDCQTVQQYINLLFDDLPPASLSSTEKNEVLLKQIASYGRKIMQISQQSTYKYRNQHFLPRKEVEQELTIIYRLALGQEPEQGYQKIIRTLIQKLQWDRKSIWLRQSLPQSRLIPQSEQRYEEHDRKPILQQQKNSVKVSRAKSKQTVPRNSTVKEVLQLKGFFEKEETVIRQFYDKVIKHIDVHKVPISSLEPQNLKFSRAVDQNTCEKMMDIVKNSTENHTKNISKLSNLVQLLHDNLNKRLRNQGTATAKLQAYFYQVKRMEEVYSYTLSKVLQNLSSMRTLLNKDPSLCLNHIETLEQITRKLYGLFPTSQSMQQLSVAQNGAKQARSFGVQANMSKLNNEKKAGSQTYRLQIRVMELIDKFEKNMKFKKNVDPKEIQKLFEVLRQMIPVSKNPTPQDINYQEQFKKLVQLQQNRQKQLIQNSAKKNKKLQKRIQQLEQNIQQQKKETAKLNEQWEQQKKKITKKIEHQQTQYKKLATQKSHLEGNISEMLKEIQSMREAVRRQGNDQTFRRMQLQKQRQQFKVKYEAALKKFNEQLQQLKLQRDRMGQERSIYKQKIDLVEGQLQGQRELSTGLRIQLENVIEQHSKLRQQLQEMSRIYEQKIKQVEQMIENIRELQQIKQSQESNINKINKLLELANQKINDQHSDIQQYLTKIDELTKEKSSLKSQVQHWKGEGKLTDTDLKALKDEVEKVNTAYLQSEELLESTRHQLKYGNEEREKLFKQKLKLTRMVQELQSQISSLRTRLQAIQLSEKDMKEQYYQKCQQTSHVVRQMQELKRQLSKLRKQQTEERQQTGKLQKQLRQIRQQSQTRRQLDSADQGKRRLELQNLRVQLRRKTQQFQKQKQSYEQRMGIMTQRIQQMQQCMGQKMLLSKLMQHQSQ